MYQVAEFIEEGGIKPVPVIWVFKDKGKMRCYWPKRGLDNKLKKRTPPPMVNSKFWDILDIKLLLNEKMFASLVSAESNSVKLASALLESKNSSNNSVSFSTINSSLATDSSCTTASSSSTKKSSSVEKVSETSASALTTVEKLSHAEKKFSLAVNNVKISSLKAFNDQELYLSSETNMNHFANYWLEKQGTNEENFIKEMVFYSFDKEYFYSHVSFKRDHNKVTLADSNILRCWIYIVGKKFGERIVLQKISSIFENIEDTSEIQLLQSAVAKEATVAVSHKSCEMIKHFPISRATVYDAVEVLFLNEDNINIIASIWTNICQNKIQLFIEAMILKTFSENFFLFDITLKKGERKVKKNGQIKGDIKEGELKKLIDGSNIFKCWEVTIKKKFPSHDVTEDEIKKYFRVLKNTLGRKNNE